MLTPEQIALRKTGLGASETAALTEDHPHMTSFDVWADKINLPRTRPQGEQLEMGNLMEGLLIRSHEERTGRKIVTDLQTIRHSEFRLMLATPDGVYADGLGLVECKNVSVYQTGPWGEPETAQVPSHVMIQVQQQMAVTRSYGFGRIGYTDVLVCFGGSERARYRVPFYPEFGDTLNGIIEDFWAAFVATKIPPIKREQMALSHLSALFPKDDGSVIQADEFLETQTARLRLLRAMIQELTGRAEEAKASIQARMGEAAALETTLGTISWKKNRDGSTLKESALIELARSLGATEDQIRACYVATEGNRPFNVPRAWKKALTKGTAANDN